MHSWGVLLAPVSGKAFGATLVAQGALSYANDVHNPRSEYDAQSSLTPEIRWVIQNADRLCDDKLCVRARVRPNLAARRGGGRNTAAQRARRAVLSHLPVQQACRARGPLRGLLEMALLEMALLEMAHGLARAAADDGPNLDRGEAASCV